MNKNGDKIIIKRASYILVKSKLGKINGEYIRTNENIINEANILKYLQQQNNSNIRSFVKFIDFFKDSRNYFLLMTNVGLSLFDHTINMHKLIECNKLNINEWKKHIKIIFKQIITFINYLHSNLKCVHMDISLENSM